VSPENVIKSPCCESLKNKIYSCRAVVKQNRRQFIPLQNDKSILKL
jgi:flagellar biosynthesis regulator FlbT